MNNFKILAFSVCLFSGSVLAQDVADAPAAAEVGIKTLEWPEGTRYVGGVLNGRMEGEGIIYWPDGTRFEGEFKNNQREGQGTLFFSDGTSLSGIFSNNQLVTADIASEASDDIQSVTNRAEQEAEAEAEQLRLAEEQAAREQAARQAEAEAEAEQLRLVEEQAAREQAARQAEAEAAAEQLRLAEEQAAREQAAADRAEVARAEAVDEAADYDSGLVYSDELENEVVAVINAWARAWSAQNEMLYLSFYADDFELPAGMNRAAWERERINRINAPGYIQVDVGFAQFELVSNDSIEVYVRQGYSSDTYNDFTNKLIELRKFDGLWKIVREVAL